MEIDMKECSELHIRRAQMEDITGLNRLLRQVLEIHHEGRPDIFKADAKKYTDEELTLLIQDDTRPIFVAVDPREQVLGYAFCVLTEQQDHHILMDAKSLYIDDLCVDEACRGQHLGRTLLEYVSDYAKSAGCDQITLNVWVCNPSAMRFYEACGFKPQRIHMELPLSD